MRTVCRACRPRIAERLPGCGIDRQRSAQYGTGLLHVAAVYCRDESDQRDGVAGTGSLARDGRPFSSRASAQELVCWSGFINPIKMPEISDKDIVFETMRSCGHGGQHVNKVETAVRATHILSGLSVRCVDERSQAHNKLKAKKRLLLKLIHLLEEVKATARHGNWDKHDSLVRRNAVKSFQVHYNADIVISWYDDVGQRIVRL